MRQEHPPAEQLERFMTGELAREEGPEVLRHLVPGCPECSVTTSRLWEVLVTGREAPRPDPEAYESAFDRAWIRATEVHQLLVRERELAKALSRELLALPPHQQRLRIRNDRRYQTLPLAQVLIDASQSAVFDNAETAAHLAEMAQGILRDLDASRYGEAIVADAQAGAWACYANALRESSDFEAAEKALLTARNFLEGGTGDPAEKAKYLSSLANLLINNRRLDDSLEVIRELEGVYSKLGDRHMVGRTQLKKAFAFSKMGDFDREILTLHQALKSLDPARDPKRQVIALHNLVLALVNADRCQEAEQHIDQLRQLHTQQGDRLNLLRFLWLEARLAYGNNDLENAARLFSQVRAAFIELEIGFDVALVSLDLAEVLWRLDRRTETQARLREAIPILEALGIHAEALAAMAFLEHAVRIQTGTRELIRQTAAFIRQVRSDPKTRFRPAALAGA